MDPATLIGVGAGFVLIMGVNIMEGGSPAALFLIAPMILVFGVTLLSTVAGGTMSDAKGAIRALKHAFTGKSRPVGDVVPMVVQLADTARKEGLLALEDSLRDIDDDFLVRGVTMAVDGIDPDELREILEGEIHAKRSEAKHSAAFFTAAGGYAPTIGIIGTVMSLVHVMENLSDPEHLGPSIASAFLATLWGILSANVMWLPIGTRLKRLSEIELARMELIVEGVAAIQAGSNPRVVAQKLRSLVPSDQQSEEAA